MKENMDIKQNKDEELSFVDDKEKCEISKN
jgi:hypothetical protein